LWIVETLDRCFAVLDNSTINNLHSTICTQQSALHNLQSTICNQQSAINNLQSAI
jgi:hypothetical protein